MKMPIICDCKCSDLIQRISELNQTMKCSSQEEFFKRFGTEDGSQNLSLINVEMMSLQNIIILNLTAHILELSPYTLAPKKG